MSEQTMAGRVAALAAAVASLNDIVAELAAEVSADPEWAELVAGELRLSSRSLGYELNIITGRQET